MKEKLKKAVFSENVLRRAIAWLDRRICYFFKTIMRLFIRVNKNQIMFISFQGDYCCNPKYISEEIIRQGLDMEIVYSARKTAIVNELFPKQGRMVEQYSAEYYEEIMKSKYLVYNSVEFMKKPVVKRRGQIWIETWHGSLGIKRFDKDHNNGIAWVKAATRLTKLTDYLISNSTFENEVYRGSYWPKTKILEYGHPRNDILFSDNSEKKQQVFEELGLDNEKKYVLYAPTFRDDHSIAYYFLNFDNIRNSLKERFGGDWEILMRLHPTVRKKAAKLLETDVIDVTSYPDIQELMLISSVAITDYSSWICRSI